MDDYDSSVLREWLVKEKIGFSPAQFFNFIDDNGLKDSFQFDIKSYLMTGKVKW